MLRLKAKKTSLYGLVKNYDNGVGSFSKAEFVKAPRVRDYFLNWHDGNIWGHAFFAACAGKAMLAIGKWELGGGMVSRTVYSLDLADLRERGMVEEFTTETERRRTGAATNSIKPF